MKKTIKVIKILSEYSVVINAGSNDGIIKGDKFDIVNSQKRILEDPDTHEILDEFNAYKAEIVAKDVREKYSICETPIHYKNSFMATQLSALSAISSLSTTITSMEDKPVQDKLNVSEYDIDNIFEKYNDSSPVIEGDHVIKIEK